MNHDLTYVKARKGLRNVCVGLGREGTKDRAARLLLPPRQMKDRERKRHKILSAPGLDQSIFVSREPHAARVDHIPLPFLISLASRNRMKLSRRLGLLPVPYSSSTIAFRAVQCSTTASSASSSNPGISRMTTFRHHHNVREKEKASKAKLHQPDINIFRISGIHTIKWQPWYWYWEGGKLGGSGLPSHIYIYIIYKEENEFSHGRNSSNTNRLGAE